MSFLDPITTALRAAPLDCTNEYRLQEGISLALRRAYIQATREWPLGPLDRIDFIANRIGIECKVDGSTSDVARQVLRYLQHDDLAGLVLVTAKARLGRHLPRSVTVRGQEKPIAVVELWRSAL